MLPDSAPLQITLRSPDDWHVHLRDGDMLTHVATFTARHFARAIIMPNLAPPVTTIEAAQAYRARIIAALPVGSQFTPLMTAYLTDSTDAQMLAHGFESGVFTAAKLYPAHATTNSAHGVSDVFALRAVLATMERIGMPLLVHGEVTDVDVDIFDREKIFVDRTLTPLLAAFPALKIVLEHITTTEAVQFVRDAPPNVAATITPHHLHINRNAMFSGGIRPHFYCLPVAKREVHRLALRQAAVSGNPKYFLGTDSAPHLTAAKESACGCAGVFNAPFALESYAEVFEDEGALDRLERFASVFGAQFYGLALNQTQVTLRREAVTVPETLPLTTGTIVPFHAGETLRWRVVSDAR